MRWTDDQPCAVCGRRTVATVTILYPLHEASLSHVPCCELCQCALNEDARTLIVYAAHERQAAPAE
jgi:hypothetical protein